MTVSGGVEGANVKTRVSPSQEKNPARLIDRDWVAIISGQLLIGVAVIICYGIFYSGALSLVFALFMAGACVFIGALLGFLFGIPKYLQSDDSSSSAATTQSKRADSDNTNFGGSYRLQYRANTNLEQISDWLTKILVGVGLTQLDNISNSANRLSNYFGHAIGTPSGFEPLALLIIIYFIIGGFLFSYLWTRLFLGGELAKADLRAVTESIRELADTTKRLNARTDEIADAVEKQSQIDAKALTLSRRYLSSKEPDKIDVEELKEAIEQSSPAVRVNLFFEAQGIRSRSWQSKDTKQQLDRTIPIFEALIVADKESKSHQNYAQLGYALKDKPEPDFIGAEKELSKAIAIRGPAEEEGWEIYEFNRAICRIESDTEFMSRRPSSPERQKEVMSDLSVARTKIPDLHDSPIIVSWLKLNKLEGVPGRES